MIWAASCLRSNSISHILKRSAETKACLPPLEAAVIQDAQYWKMSVRDTAQLNPVRKAKSPHALLTIATGFRMPPMDCDKSGVFGGAMI